MYWGGGTSEPLNAPLPGVGTVVQDFVERDLAFLKQGQMIAPASYSTSRGLEVPATLCFEVGNH